jgi:IPT/TIG domain-containing protein/glycosyl hydrolase family 16
MMRAIVLVFATLLLANSTLLASGPTFVQVKSATPQTASGSVAVTYPVAQTAGNLNVVVVGWNDTTSTVSMVSDSLANNYVLAIGPTTGTGLRQSIYYATGIKAGSNTVTVRFNQAAVYVDIRVLEYSGLDPANPLDVKAGAAGSGTSASSGAATTTSANDLILGAGMTSNEFTGPGTGFVSRIITSPDADIAEDKTVSTTGSYSATAPNSSGSWVMQMVAFRASGTSGGSGTAPKVSAISPNTGTANGGTAVTITGTGFLSGAAVTIGGTAATSVTVVGSTSITAKTPAHAAGAADVVVKNTDNQTGALSGGYTYTSGTGGGSGAPAGATFYDDFSKGSLDTSKWIPSNWGAPGGGTFIPSYLDFSTGMLRIKVTQTYNSSGGIASVGGELQSKNALGFGTYEWVMRASSTSSTPTGSGYTVSGQISSGFVFINNSQTEIDSPEIEGQNPGTLWWTSWAGLAQKQSTSTQAPFAPENGLHSYKCVWTKTSIKFYVDGVLVSTHTGVVPQTPAYAMINHWGTNSTGWGGLATPNITRYMFVRSFSFVPLQ